MTNLNNPDRFDRPLANDAMRPGAARDNELQADPEMQEGPASASRIAIYGAAIAILLGAVFYGLSSQTPSTSTAQSPPSASTADNRSTSPPVRDVTPNREPGTTTGAAPAQPVQPPQANPTGTEVDRSKGPATR